MEKSTYKDFCGGSTKASVQRFFSWLNYHSKYKTGEYSQLTVYFSSKCLADHYLKKALQFGYKGRSHAGTNKNYQHMGGVKNFPFAVSITIALRAPRRDHYNNFIFSNLYQKHQKIKVIATSRLSAGTAVNKA